MENAKMKNKKTKKKETKSIRLFRILFIFAVLAIVGFGAFDYYKQALGPMSKHSPQEVSITIPVASSSTQIADILYDNGLIKNQLLFKYQVKNKNVASKLKAGEYNLSTGMDLDTIIDKLTIGVKNYNTVRFTIPEGYEIRQMADKLSNEGIIDKERFLELVGNKDNFEDKFIFLKELDNNQSLEGFLFPSTYEIYIGSSEEEIIEKMLNEFDKIYKKDIEPRLKDIDLTLNEAITLASIVEREGKVDKERPLMSAVFHNRLDQGMMLQSCATVQYILGERKEVLSNEDTRTPSPYNTYIHEGLPPAPIASPGKASLIAAVQPADVDYLFFVLTGNDGTHTFTTTYKDHLNAKPKK
ncbi:endolytic transglycosylase MltG [Tissierella sp.]|uniref:endolytic transglycosylase MltG n=1 Tax=Tissierella sp. TaxID=41274 RepID=UPI00285D86DD|nr:endolytic transglycosylase MltG [Tissierella sp.]MDR7856005.1 endolytic transglycosylase MltG [Tissierella sp.]